MDGLLVPGATREIGFGNNSTEQFKAGNDALKGVLASSGAVLNKATSGTAPTLLPNKDDPNTGVGSPAADQCSLIAGGVEGVRVSEAGGVVTVTEAGVKVSSHDDITSTSEGVAAAITTATTFVTTDGDSDLNNVTLADGVEDQEKTICCVAEGNAADTWKVTPANMVGGTQITFAGDGEGCVFKMHSTGWVVVGNNGGTIS